MSNNIKKFDANELYASKFDLFEGKLNGESKSFFHQYRKDALNLLKATPFPTLKHEEWKYTSVKPILKKDFIPASLAEKLEVTSEEVDSLKYKDYESNLVVLVNGIFDKDLSKIDELPSGILIDSLKNVIVNKPELVERFKDKFQKAVTAFDALNTTFASDGLVVFIPKGKVMEKTLHILSISGSENETVLSNPRNIFIAEENTEGKIVHQYVGKGSNYYLTNVVNDFYLGQNAILDYYKIQDEKDESYHIDKTDAYQNKNSVFSHFSFSFGGEIARTDLSTILDDEFITTNYYGLYLAKDKQHVDHHTFVDHAKPNCESNELYKGILDGESRGVFSGKIMVRQDAQKTNAYQSNKSILLSDNAVVDTKPQLEIFADDVKCSHGATIGRLDETAYFYIRSRGVPADLAKSMLIRAFANDVVEGVKIEHLKEQLNHMIFEHLNQIEIED
ncbi:MAG: Fe-S cluster assembly protein SufD [Melioribacteraceae bacterium]|nr:Fe-S cluster assembly protein SufD [Melioribacteraceae bacterium]MCF8266223.1 Fe-S cluster assembly protein SufD [Melioribacteraceae bacterium]